jgi:hypothetical protein
LLTNADDGTVPLTKADLRALSRETDGDDSEDETLVDDTEAASRDVPVKTERIILRNATRHQAVQINAAIEKDIWQGISRLVIRDNVAEDQSLQVNHGTTLDVTMLLLELQGKRMGANQPRLEKKRHDSVLST